MDSLELREFPVEAVAMTVLRSLSVKNNRISALPAVIGQLQGLERLSLDGNQAPPAPPAASRARRPARPAS